MNGQTEPVRRSPDVTEAEIHGGTEEPDIVIADPDPAWRDKFTTHGDQIESVLGPIARKVEHIGSTSVPGLAAKPIVDILVTVADITAEEDYLDPLLHAGYLLRVREPGHRMLRTPELDVHVHILGVDTVEAEDYLLLRDHLRTHQADRALYEDTKRQLAAQKWPDMDAYADAKTAVISEIKERARAMQGE